MDKKITQLPAATNMRPADLFLIVQDPNGTPVNKKITNVVLFGNIQANVSISNSETEISSTNLTIEANSVFNGTQSANNSFRVKGSGGTVIFGDAVNNRAGILTETPTAPLDVNGDQIRLRTQKTPMSSNAVAASVSAGTFFWDANYLYIAVNGTTVKRVALSSF